ncbi:unnamed protein product [Caenorhabditis sp. 36 PRJEB53466]|nr:unnamed protein product [Caenorhabditis sp. 36 PRJEB53466]
MSARNELKEYANRNSELMKREERDHQKEMKELEASIKATMNEFTKARKNLEKQKEKDKAEVEVLKLEHEKTLNTKRSEIREMQKKNLAEISKKKEELQVLETQFENGRRSTSNAMAGEKIVRKLNFQLFELNRLWLLVTEEHETILVMNGIGSNWLKWKDVFVNALGDMKEKKKEMNDRVAELKTNADLQKYVTSGNVSEILQHIGNPLQRLDQLERVAKTGILGDVNALQKEVMEVGKWVQKLREVRLAPPRTVMQVLDSEGVFSIINS